MVYQLRGDLRPVCGHDFLKIGGNAMSDKWIINLVFLMKLILIALIFIMCYLVNRKYKRNNVLKIGFNCIAFLLFLFVMDFDTIYTTGKIPNYFLWFLIGDIVFLLINTLYKR